MDTLKAKIADEIASAIVQNIPWTGTSAEYAAIVAERALGPVRDILTPALIAAGVLAARVAGGKKLDESEGLRVRNQVSLAIAILRGGESRVCGGCLGVGTVAGQDCAACAGVGSVP